MSSKQIHTVSVVPWDVTSWRGNVYEKHPCWWFSVVIKHYDPRWFMDERVFSGLWFWGGILHIGRHDSNWQGRRKEQKTKNSHLDLCRYKAEREEEGDETIHSESPPPGTYFLPASVPLLNFPDSITSWNQVFRFETFLIQATIHVLWYITCFCWWASFHGVQMSCVSFPQDGEGGTFAFSMSYLNFWVSWSSHVSL